MTGTYNRSCEDCGGIFHRSHEERDEIHGATERIHAWLKERMNVVMNAEPVEPGALFVRPPKQAKVPLAHLLHRRDMDQEEAPDA